MEIDNNENNDNDIVINDNLEGNNTKNKTIKEKNIKLSIQIIKIIVWIIWLYIANSILMPLIESHWFNWLMILIHPWLWGLIVWPILIINGIYNIIFYFLIKNNISSKERLIPIKNIIWLVVLAIFPIIYFIWWLKMFFSDNPFWWIYNFPFISWWIIIFIWFKIRENLLKLKK